MDEGPPPRPDPDLRLRRRVAGQVTELAAAFGAASAAYPELASTLAPLADEHQKHITALVGRPAARSSDDSGSASPTASPEVPATLAATLDWLIALEGQAARRRRSQSLDAGPDLARLLASIGASEAVHATLLGGTRDAARASRPATCSEVSSTVDVLQTVLAAEHAVIYGYGVAGAHLHGAPRRRAERGWTEHRARRDDLEARLSAAGKTPAPPAPAYALPSPVDSPHAARALLTLLEERLAAVWADAVGNLTGDLRGLAVDGLGDAAVAAAKWRGASVAFPGLPERE